MADVFGAHELSEPGWRENPAPGLALDLLSLLHSRRQQRAETDSKCAVGLLEIVENNHFDFLAVFADFCSSVLNVAV